MAWCGHSAAWERRHDRDVLARCRAGTVLVGLPAFCTAARRAILMDANTMFRVLLAAFLGIVVLCVKPLGSYIADVMQGKPNFALRAGGRVETFLYRICGI